MAKQFLANRSGQTPTLDEVPNEVIKIYDDKATAQADISNIEENEIIATKAGESEGVVEVVDTVEENNPNAVSSGAVYDYVVDPIIEQELDRSDGRAWIVYKSGRVQYWERKSVSATSTTEGVANVPYAISKLLNVQITARHPANGTSRNNTDGYWYSSGDVHYYAQSTASQNSIGGVDIYVDYIKTSN